MGQNDQVKQAYKILKEFLKIWEKFRNIYKTVLSRREIQHKDEILFGDTLSVIHRRIEDLKRALDVNRERDKDVLDALYKTVSLKSLANVSDAGIEQLNKDWEKVDVFLRMRYAEVSKEITALDKKKSLWRLLCFIKRSKG